MGTLGILDHPHKNHSINFSQTFLLICMQQINFIICFFLNILQTNSKHFTLRNVGMPGHTSKRILSKNLWRLSGGKKINFFLHVFLEILQRYYKLVVLGTWLSTSKVTPSTSRNFLCLSASKNWTSSSMLFLVYSKDIQTYFEIF